MLIAVADRLRSAVRTHDTLARLSGDEFVVLCEGLHADLTTVIAQRLAAALADPLVLRESPISMGASIGIAVTDSAEDEPEVLLREADLALYRAKEQRTGTASTSSSSTRVAAYPRRQESAWGRSLDDWASSHSLRPPLLAPSVAVTTAMGRQVGPRLPLAHLVARLTLRVGRCTLCPGAAGHVPYRLGGLPRVSLTHRARWIQAA